MTTANNSSSSNNKVKTRNANEAGHYVVTAHRPGGVIDAVKCSFLEPNSIVSPLELLL